MNMKKVYPVVISKEKDGYFVSIPDFDTSTQGYDLENAIEMAKDVIKLVGTTLLDKEQKLPAPSAQIKKEFESDTITFVEVEF